MIFILLLVGVALCYWLGGFHADVLEWRHQRRVDEVKSQLHRADRALEAEARRTRRAMNDAAGQSWRNLTDGGPRG